MQNPDPDLEQTTDPARVSAIQRAFLTNAPSQRYPASARDAERLNKTKLLQARTIQSDRARPHNHDPATNGHNDPPTLLTLCSCSSALYSCPAPSQLPPFLPEHAGNFQKEAFSRQIGDARTAAVVVFVPRRVKSTAATPFVRGRGERGRLLSLVEGQASGNRY